MYVDDVDNHESSVSTAAAACRRIAPQSTRLRAWDAATRRGALPVIHGAFPTTSSALDTPVPAHALRRAGRLHGLLATMKRLGVDGG